MAKIRAFSERDDIYPQDVFESLFMQAPMGIALIDSLTAHIYETNLKYAKITGRSIKELKSMNWIELTHPDDIQTDLDNMADMNSGKTRGFEMRKRYVQPNGNIVWIHMSVASVRVTDPNKPRHLCMILDITDRIIAEEKLSLFAEEMEMVSEELRLKNDALEIAKETLSLANVDLKIAVEALEDRR